MTELESGEADRVLAELISDLLYRTLKFRLLPGGPVDGIEISAPVKAAHPDDGQEFIIRGRGGTCHVDVYPGRAADANTSSLSDIQPEGE